jgi:hypothetical protein
MRRKSNAPAPYKRHVRSLWGMSEHRAITDALSVVMAVYGSENAKALKDFHRIIAELDYEQTEKLVEALRTVLKNRRERATSRPFTAASSLDSLSLIHSVQKLA